MTNDNRFKLPVWGIRGKLVGVSTEITLIGSMGGNSAEHAIERHKAWAKREGLKFEYASAFPMPGEFEYV